MYASQSHTIISDLVARTKATVREMDKQNARKIKKFLMDEYMDDSTSLTESNGSLQHDELSLPDDSQVKANNNSDPRFPLYTRKFSWVDSPLSINHAFHCCVTVIHDPLCFCNINTNM